MEYGLVGKNVANSYSKLIHSLFASYTYDLKSIDEKYIVDFFSKRLFKGINITMPYKKEVIPYLHLQDEIVKATGVANTVINKNGKLYGYNTDYYGFKSLLKHFKIDVHDKVVAILGTGATSDTVYKVLEDEGASKIYKVSCHKKVHKNTLSLTGLYSKVVDIIINTTPLGKEEYFDESPIDVTKMDSTKIIIDVNYEFPYSTLMLQGLKQNKKVYNGLYMLVAQAKEAAEKFSGIKITKKKELEVFKKLEGYFTSYAIYGMPYSGKTTLASMYSEKHHVDALDSDVAIEKMNCLSIPRLIELKGLDYFRELEKESIHEFAKMKHIIISLGGGTLMDEDNYLALKHNFKFILLKRNVDEIIFDSSRPLASSKEDYLKLENERNLRYASMADKVINSDDLDEALKELEVYIDEVSNN